MDDRGSDCLEDLVEFMNLSLVVERCMALSTSSSRFFFLSIFSVYNKFYFLFLGSIMCHINKVQNYQRILMEGPINCAVVNFNDEIN